MDRKTAKSTAIEKARVMNLLFLTLVQSRVVSGEVPAGTDIPGGERRDKYTNATLNDFALGWASVTAVLMFH